MGGNLEIKGIDETLAKLRNISVTVDRNKNRIIRDSAEPYMEALKKITPYDSRENRKHPQHAKEHIVRTNVVHNEDGDSIVKVGYDSDTGWYMWFLEKGTYSKGAPKGIAPRHYVEKTLESTKGEVAKVQEEGLRRLIERFT